MLFPREQTVVEALRTQLDGGAAAQGPNRFHVVTGPFWHGQQQVVEALAESSRAQLVRLSLATLPALDFSQLTQHLATQLGLGDLPSGSPARALLERWRSNPNARTLVVFEDAEQSRSAGDPVSELLFGLGNASTWSGERWLRALLTMSLPNPIVSPGTLRVLDAVPELAYWLGRVTPHSLRALSETEVEEFGARFGVDARTSARLYEETLGHPWFVRRAIDLHRIQGRLVFTSRGALQDAESPDGAFRAYFDRVQAALKTIAEAATYDAERALAPDSSTKVRLFFLRYMLVAGTSEMPPILARWWKSRVSRLR